MDALISLISPIGLIPLFILAGGVVLYILVALGGWGVRTLTPNSKAFLGTLGTVLTLIGLIGIILIVYPVVRPNVILIQQDLNLPNTLSTPFPKPTPTPLSPEQQARIDRAETAMSVVVVLILLPFFILIYAMTIGTARTMLGFDNSPPSFLPRFPRLPRFRGVKTSKETRSVTYRPSDDEE